MKYQIFLFILLVYCVVSVSCSEKNDLITNSDENTYINLKPDKSLFTQKDNIEKLIIAKRRFNQYVYQDENKKYQVSLKDGKKINVSDDLFEFMKKALYSREEKEKLNTGLSKAKPFPSDPFLLYVVGDIKAIWDHFFAKPLYECGEIMDECIQYLISVTLITVHFANGDFFPFLIKDERVYPGFPYVGPIIAQGSEFHTMLPNGIYPCPSNGNLYVAVRKGFATCTGCPFSFQWDRGIRFYNRSDAELVDDYYYGDS